MRKDMIIAALGAALITRDCPWFRICPWDQQAAVWLGFFIVLLFFCLFCEEKAEKWRKYRIRVDRMQGMIIRIRKIRRAG